MVAFLLGLICWLFGFNGGVLAYVTGTCEVRNTSYFGLYSASNNQYLIETGVAGALWILPESLPYPGLGLGQDDWQDWEVYVGRLGSGGSWQLYSTTYNSGYFVVSNFGGISTVGDYGLGIYLKNTDAANNGAVDAYYCTGLAKVYSRGGISDDNWWMGRNLVASRDEWGNVVNFEQDGISSATGGQVVAYAVSYTMVNDPSIPWDSRTFGSIGSDQFADNGVVYCGSSCTTYSQFGWWIHPPSICSSGTCTSTVRVSSFSVFERSSAPYFPPPPPPGTNVLGYVREVGTNDPVEGATVQITRMDTNQALTLTTNANGYWVGNFEDSGISRILIQETNAGFCSLDDGNPTVLPAGMTITNLGTNLVDISSPPNSVGPVTFYDDGCAFPTPTPTPAPVVYCPLAQSQENGMGVEGLSTTYVDSVGVTAVGTGLVDKLEVKVGNSGGGERTLTCKVTDAAGMVDISAEKSVVVAGSSATAWRTLDYKGSEFSLMAGTTYRIYCKSSDTTNNLFWTYNNITNGVAPNGKTFRIYQCPQAPPTFVSLVIKNEVGVVIVPEN